MSNAIRSTCGLCCTNMDTTTWETANLKKLGHVDTTIKNKIKLIYIKRKENINVHTPISQYYNEIQAFPAFQM